MSVSKARKAAIRILALRYIANHMIAVLDVQGPHELVETDEEDDYLIKIFKDEANKILVRAARAK